MPLTPGKRFLLFFALAYLPSALFFVIAGLVTQWDDELIVVHLFIFLFTFIPSGMFNLFTGVSAVRDSNLLIRCMLMHLLLFTGLMLIVFLSDGKAEIAQLIAPIVYAVFLGLTGWPGYRQLRKREKNAGTDVISTIGNDIQS